MTWEETIQFIRTQPEYNDLVDQAYFNPDLPVNVEKYRNSAEFKATLVYLKKYQPLAKSILDIGSGNGITAISFALAGYTVTTVEPDPSNTIGAGAIRILKEYYKLDNITIYEAFAEELQFEANSFDIVFARQCMHHAYNLNSFVAESARVLKPKGLFITVRDHVIYNESDKQWFLKCHPLQKFYGGENAFTSVEYKSAIVNAGLDLKEELKFYDSVINYFPYTESEILSKIESHENEIQRIIKNKIPVFYNVKFINNWAKNYLNKKVPPALQEEKIAGRMYTYIAIKS